MILFFTAVGVVLVISFMCSIFESVLLSVTRPQVEVLGRSHSAASNLLTRFKDNMDVPIAAVLILNTAAHTIGTAVAGASYVDAFSASTLWLFSILFTLAVLLLTEIIPKTLGVSHAVKLAPGVAHGIRWLTVVLKPLVVLSEYVSRSLRGDSETQVTSAEEIRLLALLGRGEGIIGTRMAHMIVGATQMRDMRVHDIMLPRDDVKFMSGSMQREQAQELVRVSGLSRFPYTPTDDLDDVSGVVIAKDLLYWLVTHDEDVIDWDAVRLDPLVVPENLPLPKLMRTFQESRRHLAIVVDEYGGVEGIATLEEVLEEIVGEIEDETDRPSQDVLRLDDGSLLVPATVDLRKLSSLLEIAWDPEGEAATVGGLVTETLERIPAVGDSIVWYDFRITVLQSDSHRAVFLSVRKL